MPIKRDIKHKPYCLGRISVTLKTEEITLVEYQVLTEMEYQEVLYMLETQTPPKSFMKISGKFVKIHNISFEIVSKDTEICDKYLDLAPYIRSDSLQLYDEIIERRGKPICPYRIGISDWVNFISNFGLEWYVDKYPYYKFLSEYLNDIDPEKFINDVRHKEIRTLVARGFLVFSEKGLINLGKSEEVISTIANQH